ncbi:hypothetical protein Mycsm_06555 (plasmid) [Mycobacterium sp. JS623]|uniref:baseplate J/gp47 family protein n=1 Tax=Mycobacterium sp. JS623 TaxID=212767 RepID=UPI0002A55500|nr:baseplate J/gp47 family protein [Mycobacterium sp. JS623]AGB26692.1 hypothetical protein Mycsm_06555 [Mycobacterium sp. JS623]
MIFSCGTSARRRLVRASAALNGIDYVEVGTGNGPDARRTLLVHCLKPFAAPVPAAGLWHIDGGERYRGITVLRVEQTTDPYVLRLTTSAIGDLSWYTLRLADDSLPLDLPPAGYDPALAQVDFTFRPGCGTDLDCHESWTPGAPAVVAPDIDYTAKDYLAFRRVLKDRFAITQPDSTGDEPADVRTTLLELLAYAADRLSYIQDAVATEAYLGTARRRISVRRHTLLVDYAMHDGCTARAWVRLCVKPGPAIPAPQRTDLVRLVTGPEGQSCVVDTGSSEAQALRLSGAQVFEIIAAPKDLHHEHNAIDFYTWSGVTCLLPAGATSATLAGALPNLAPGDVLVLAAVDQKSPDDVDEQVNLAHPVRLTFVQTTTDPLVPGPGGAVTEVRWADNDALPSALRLTKPKTAPDGTPTGDNLPAAKAFGNIVLADQGEHVRDATGAATTEALAPQDYPSLASGPVSQRPPLPDAAAPAAAAMTWAIGAVHPCLDVTAGQANWTIVRDLVNPDPTGQQAVLEVDDAGVGWLRFSRPPDPHDNPRASYAVGNGSLGNVGARTITRLIHDGKSAGLAPALTRVSNPLAAFGGVDAETIAHARQHAPFAFRTQRRCITPADYAARCTQFPGVQRAFAQLLWTGSWHTVCLYVERTGGARVDPDFADKLRGFLEPQRMMCSDLEVRNPIYVPLDLTLTVCPSASADWPTVRATLGRLFGARVQPDGTPGLFHPDRLSLGSPVYTGPLIAAAVEVPGVVWAEITDLHTVGTPTPVVMADGRLALDPPLVPLLDNDPNFPDRGTCHIKLAAAS